MIQVAEAVTAAAGMDLTMRELYRCFREANQHFYAGLLPEPQIVVQTRGRKRALGWCTREQVWSGAGERRYEITVTAESLGRGTEAVAATLMHELVHLYNRIRSVSDCSTHQHHNSRFRDAALQHGLLVEQSETYGWGHTSLAPDTRTWLASLQVAPAAFSLSRHDRHRQAADPDGMAGKMQRWACGCTNIRAATMVDAVCRQCRQPFRLGGKAPRRRVEERDDDE